MSEVGPPPQKKASPYTTYTGKREENPTTPHPQTKTTPQGVGEKKTKYCQKIHPRRGTWAEKKKEHNKNGERK